ncbi:MAG TPA: energy-coupling factor ABC transporter permease [Burkholderiaceae bacterium]|nr:energy-coupling factor ABC transporter permease [Burkholderiaceae bacterium]
MSLLHAAVPSTLAFLGWMVTLTAAAQSAWTLRHRFLPTPALQHGWLAGVATVALLWAMHVRSPTGLDFGLLGSALFALVFGRERAMLGLLAAVALYTLMDGGEWRNVGINGVVFAIAPAWLTIALQRQLETRLPKNLFVFIIGNGLFVTLVATAGTTLLMLGLSLAEAPSPHRLLGDHLAYSLLLAWGEALVSGMLFSALVVFAPGAVLTYRQDLYLPRPGLKP